MSWEVILLKPVESWFLELAITDRVTAVAIQKAIDRLAEGGPALGRPLVDTLEHSNLRNLKELRPGSSGRSKIRLLFVFDPDRAAILLVGGDKAGQWSRWYDKAIPLAEARYADYRAELEKEANR
ncbi:addiction module toxin RelE [Herbidospora sp. NEAU-GS84]|uniref:Addiction module toxin RelE n=1 Tax=Herbidospora solisilvae TaxID=2696284 RepID=A0A7C9NLH2_9ACTN|nr:type II toxin-antitoxin system RelE/ParE family toxin [Herbidospora solisilvae]NAS25592.1 addiction module toxin RelE [Herbidospora solisilvae]